MTVLDDNADFTTVANTGIARAIVNLLKTEDIDSMTIDSTTLSHTTENPITTTKVKSALINVLTPLMPNNILGDLKGKTIKYSVASKDISVDYELIIK